MVAGQPIRGLVGQRMSGRKGVRSTILSMFDTTSTGAGSLTAPATCVAHVYLFGGGGSSRADGSATGSPGGGGGAALFKRVPVVTGQVLTYSVAATDQATTLTTPAAALLSAGAGQTPVASSANCAGGVGGVAVGGDINRNGGAGGGVVAGVGQDGQAVTNGGSGGLHNSWGAGGGACAGFADITSAWIGGTGGAGAGGVIPTGTGGGGGGSAGVAVAGAGGRIIVVFIRSTTT